MSTDGKIIKSSVGARIWPPAAAVSAAAISGLEAVPKLDFELAYIDDGSLDATLNVLRELQHADVRVWVLALSRNFGHQMAVTGGDVVLLIDADLQDPPEVIPPRLDRWRTGADVAYGVRSQRTGETRFKHWTAHAFYRLLDRLTDPGGEVLRVVGFRRPLRAPALRVAGTLVIERVLDVAVLVRVFFLGLLCRLPSWASANPAAARTTPNA